MAKKFKITEQQKRELEKRLEATKEENERNLAAIVEAKGHGDLSENAEYSAAKEKEEKLRQDMAELQYYLENAEVITEDEISDETIGIGNEVVIQWQDDLYEETIVITAPGVSEPLENKISIDSPLGERLRGHRVDEQVLVQTPKGEVFVKIKAISIPIFRKEQS